MRESDHIYMQKSWSMEGSGGLKQGGVNECVRVWINLNGIVLHVKE